MPIYDTIEHGQGTPLVMLHGMMGEPSNWEGVLPYLPASCHAAALRFPFFADDVRLDSVEATTEYARGYLDDMDHGRIVLCGNSLGGHVALNLAMEMPERIRGIILTASSGLFERSFGSASPHPSRDWVRGKMCEIFYDESHVTEGLVDWVVSIISVRRNARDLVRIAKSAKRDNIGERLRNIACPSLLIWGRQDEVTPPYVAEEFRSKLPRSELVWIEKCGHAPMLEHPRPFAEHLRRWWHRHICPQDSPEPGQVTT